MWDFIQDEIFGMKWLNRLIGSLLNACGLDTSGKLGGSLQFFIYDTIKIMILLGFLIFVITYIQSYFPPERTKKILSRFHGIGANCIAALLVMVQKHILSVIEKIHNIAYRNIKFNLSDDFDESMKNPILKRIYEIWETQYSDTEFTWDEIAEVLCESIEPIMIKVVNSARNSDKLVYPENEGIRVIAIGGLALSRGLTLEGLIISYFYRNTCTYDVLMQMGRWFGYRRG